MANLTEKLNTLIGGQTTPQIAKPVTTPSVKSKVVTVVPPRSKTSGSNAQTEGMEKNMKLAMKNTKTYGVPGAK